MAIQDAQRGTKKYVTCGTTAKQAQIQNVCCKINYNSLTAFTQSPTILEEDDIA